MKSFLPKLRNVRVFLDQKITTYKFPYTGFSTIEPAVMQRTLPLADEFAPCMHLPCMDIVNFDEEDQQLLSNVRHEDDVYRVAQRYVLRRSGSASQTDCYNNRTN